MNRPPRLHAASAIVERARLSALGALVLVSTWSASAGADPLHYRVQPEASEVTFRATSRMMNADGRFPGLRGDVVADPKDLSTAKVTVSIEAASIATGIGLRDNHLRSDDFLDVKKFPAIAFESTRVQGEGQRLTVFGRLTLHGVTHEIEVPVELALTDVALVASGEFVVNRGDYGMNYQSVLNPIGNVVRVAFTFRAHTP
jgi:polyisoprenoid-binding protein YceI